MYADLFADLDPWMIPRHGQHGKTACSTNYHYPKLAYRYKLKASFVLGGLGFGFGQGALPDRVYRPS